MSGENVIISRNPKGSMLMRRKTCSRICKTSVFNASCKTESNSLIHLLEILAKRAKYGKTMDISRFKMTE